MTQGLHEVESTHTDGNGVFADAAAQARAFGYELIARAFDELHTPDQPADSESGAHTPTD